MDEFDGEEQLHERLVWMTWRLTEEDYDDTGDVEGVVEIVDGTS